MNVKQTGKKILLVMIGCAVLVSLVTLSERSQALAREDAKKNVWMNAAEYVTKMGGRSAADILEIPVYYDASQSSTISLGTLQRKSGYIPTTDPDETGLTLQIVDKNGDQIYRQSFALETELELLPSQDGAADNHGSVRLQQTSTVLTVPWMARAAVANILSAEGDVIATAQVDGLKHITNTPNFHSIKGDQMLRGENNLEAVSFNFLDLFSEQAFAANDGAVDVTFILSDYGSSTELFHADVDRFIEHLLAYEPYRSRADQIVFHYVDNTSDLGCRYDAEIPRLLVCNNSLVTSAVNTAGAPYDKIVVIVNNSTYGGSGGTNVAVAYNGSQGHQVFAHEFGHTFGGLHDEYTLYTSNGYIDGSTYANCYAGTTLPAAEWNNVALGDYKLGCRYPNWYRSYPTSIMLDLSYQYFNTVSQVQLNKRIDNFAGTTTDSIAPTAAITSPAANAVIRGYAVVSATAADNEGVAWVELWKDGVLFKSLYASPYNFSWNTSLDQDGAHTLAVKAYDVVGNIGISEIEVTTDSTAPSVAVTSPLNGAVVTSGSSQTIRANATDSSGVSKVEFFVNGVLICTDSTASNTEYSCGWTVPKGKNKQYTIQAKGYDIVNNVSSASVTVTSK